MSNFDKKLTSELLIFESVQVDTRVYHEAYLWPGAFVYLGLVDPYEARSVGYHGIGHSSTDPTSVNEFEVSEYYIDYLLDLPDDDWIAVLKYHFNLFIKDCILDNIKIIDKTYDGHALVILKYIVDVNLKQFYRANGWAELDIKDAFDSGSLKTIRKL